MRHYYTARLPGPEGGLYDGKVLGTAPTWDEAKRIAEASSSHAYVDCINVITENDWDSGRPYEYEEQTDLYAEYFDGLWLIEQPQYGETP